MGQGREEGRGRWRDISPAPIDHGPGPHSALSLPSVPLVMLRWNGVLMVASLGKVCTRKR